MFYLSCKYKKTLKIDFDLFSLKKKKTIQHVFLLKFLYKEEFYVGLPS